MKKLLIVFIAGLILFSSFSPSEAIVREVAKKWDDAPVAADVAWTLIGKDGNPVQEIKPSMNPDSGQPVDHIFLFSCPKAAVINLQLKFNSTTKVFTFNSGNPISASDGHRFSVILHSGMTENLQRQSGTQACAGVDAESFNLDL